MANDVSRHGMWSSRLLFVLAAAGSAVGLGNIWKFPYITGENGGGAFVVVYLLCIALIGVPVMMAEVLLGRAGRQSPINTMRALVERSGGHAAWTAIGWLGVVAGFLILSFYAVIAGWAFYYVVRLAKGEFDGADGTMASAAFNDFLADPWGLLLWHTAFMAVTVFIIARGVAGGLEMAVRWLMPLLFALLIGLVCYAAVYGDFAAGAGFLFSFDLANLTAAGTLTALGHAFFTLSLGMGAIMAYGAYVPGRTSITSTVATIAVLDTVVALAVGLAIFPIVFATPGLEPGEGPGLLFVTVPVAFGSLPLGALVGAIFFILVSFAAVTSAISLTEPALAFLVEEYNAKRSRVAITIGAGCWLLGIGSALSFNAWAEYQVFGMTFFDLVDNVSGKIMLPLGGLLIALFAGWVLTKDVVREQLNFAADWQWQLWTVTIRFVAPVGVVVVFSHTIYDFFTAMIG